MNVKEPATLAAAPVNDRVSHLMRVSAAAKMLGISTKRFIRAANDREMGSVELLPLGDETFVRARSVLDFIDGAPTALSVMQSAHPASDEPDEDLFGLASTVGGI